MLIKSKKIRMECLRQQGKNPFKVRPRFNWRTELAVRGALQRLSVTEKEIVERFHFCGNSCAEIAALLKLPKIRIHALLKKGRRKLKTTLGLFVQKRYGIPPEVEKCRVCLSERRESIEKLLQSKTQEETWKRILQKLKTNFGIHTSTRSLSRHLKEHGSRIKKKSGESIT